MSVSENFDRKFSKCMRGYNPEEVDSAVDALLRYCDELEAANREFEIANNDLIDEKTALVAQKEDLEKKVTELSDSLSRIEGVYNEYREKFGEARDLVGNAKVSAAEILTRARTKSDFYIEEAEKKRDNIINQLDKDVANRNALIKSLEESFEKFKAEILKNIKNTSDAISGWNTSCNAPEIPEYIKAEPETKGTSTSFLKDTLSENFPAELEFSEPQKKEKEFDSAPKAEEAEKEGVQKSTEIHSSAPERKPNINGIPIKLASDKTNKEDNRSEQIPTSNIKSSVEKINDRVIAKKSIPHI